MCRNLNPKVWWWQAGRVGAGKKQGECRAGKGRGRRDVCLGPNRGSERETSTMA